MNTYRYLKGFFALFGRNRIASRRARLELAARIAQTLGDFVVLDDYLLWTRDTEFRRRYRELSPENRFSEPRKWVLREYARQVAPLEGRLAECGVYRGASAWFLANELPDCDLHLFDSFEGLSAVDANDSAVPETRGYWKKGSMRAAVDEAQQNLRAFGNIHFHRGWIPARFDDVADFMFKLVHVDVDLYEPTLESVRFFYPRLVEGGVMIFDDYGMATCPGAFKALHEYFDPLRVRILHLPTGQGIVVKQRQ